MTELKQIKKFKDSKLGLIPSDWQIKIISELASVDENSLKATTDNNYTFDYISLSDVHQGVLSNELETFYFSKAPSRARRKVKKNSILMATVRPNLQSFCFIDKDDDNLIASTGFAVIDVNSENDSRFIYQFLFSSFYAKQIYSLVVGSNYPAINSSDVKKLKVPTPPLKEQQKIAEILSKWDEAITTTQNLIEQLQLRKKGLMQQLLSGKKRLAGFSEKWKEDKLGSYFTERKETDLENLQLLSVGKEGVYPQDDSNKKDTSNTNKSKYKRICKGDIGYNTMRMWQGRSALSQLEGIVSPAYTILKPKENCDSVFFSYLFKLDDMVHKFYRNSQGMVSDTWMCKFKDFKIIKFNAPLSLEEQKAISKIIALADTEIEEKKTLLLKLKEQKKGLMQQLLTGKKRVKLD